MPTIASIAQHASRVTDVTFSGVPNEAAAETIGNWSATNGLVITGAERMTWNALVVRLTHSRMTEGQSYSFTASTAITGSGDSSGSVTSAIPTPSAMTLVECISRDSQHTDYVFSYEVADAYLSGTYFTCPNSATFTSATKQADTRVVRVKHANLANGAYTASVSASLKSVYGEACETTSASVTVDLQHDTTAGLKIAGVYGGKLLGCGPAADMLMAYVSDTPPSEWSDDFEDNNTTGWTLATKYTLDATSKVSGVRSLRGQQTASGWGGDRGGTRSFTSTSEVRVEWTHRFAATTGRAGYVKLSNQNDNQNIACSVVPIDGTWYSSGANSDALTTYVADTNYACAIHYNATLGKYWVKIGTTYYWRETDGVHSGASAPTLSASVGFSKVGATTGTAVAYLVLDNYSPSGTAYFYMDDFTVTSYASIAIPSNLHLYRSADNSTFVNLHGLYPSSAPTWAANTQYNMWDVVKNAAGTRTFQAIRILGKTTAVRGKSKASAPSWMLTAGATTADTTTDVTNGDELVPYVGGTPVYGVYWQENTSALCEAALLEDGKAVYLLRDRAPKYRDQPIEMGATAYYKATFDDYTFSSVVSAERTVDRDGQRDARLYQWRTQDVYKRRYTYAPAYYDRVTQDPTQPHEEYQVCARLISLAFAFYITNDPEYLWFYEKQLDHVQTYELDGTHRLLEIYFDETNSNPNLNQTPEIGLDQHGRNSWYAYSAYRLLARAGETTLSASTLDVIDAWTSDLFDTTKVQRPTLNLSTTDAVRGTTRTFNGPLLAETYATTSPSFPLAGYTGSLIFNKAATIAALGSALYADPNSSHYQSATLGTYLESLNDFLAISIDPDDGEMQYGTYYVPGSGNHRLASAVYQAFAALNLLIADDAKPDATFASIVTDTLTWFDRDFPTWQADHAYALGDTVVPVTGTGGGTVHFVYVCTTAGTSDASEPAWGITHNGTTADNEVVWQARQNFATEPLLEGNYPNRDDGSQYPATFKSGIEFRSLLYLLAGLYDTWPLRYITSSSAFIDPITLKMPHFGAVTQYSPTGFVSEAAGGADKTAFYGNGNQGAYTDDLEGIYTALFAPADPSGLTATVNGTAVDLAWTDNSSDETSFSIEEAHDWVGADPSDGDWSLVATTDPNATTYSDTNPPLAAKLRYRIASFTGPAGSDWVESNDVSTLIARAFYYRMFVC